MLNRHIPLDTIARWWYVLVAGASLGLIFRLATGITPFSKILSVPVVEAPTSGVQDVLQLIEYPGWKEDLLFAVLGILLASAVIWLLEEVRAFLQRSRQL